MQYFIHDLTSPFITFQHIIILPFLSCTSTSVICSDTCTIQCSELATHTNRPSCSKSSMVGFHSLYQMAPITSVSYFTFLCLIFHIYLLLRTRGILAQW